jgi:hypothetical protein
MPMAFSVHHDQYLDNFIEQGRMNIVKEEYRFLLVKNKKKFIFPVVAKVRLENYSTEDFGASALITPINLSYSYFIATPLGKL